MLSIAGCADGTKRRSSPATAASASQRDRSDARLDPFGSLSIRSTPLSDLRSFVCRSALRGAESLPARGCGWRAQSPVSREDDHRAAPGALPFRTVWKAKAFLGLLGCSTARDALLIGCAPDAAEFRSTARRSGLGAILPPTICSPRACPAHHADESTATSSCLDRRHDACPAP